jgi:hypothetical protein
MMDVAGEVCWGEIKGTLKGRWGQVGPLGGGDGGSKIAVGKCPPFPIPGYLRHHPKNNQHWNFSAPSFWDRLSIE